jgi:multidrug efflux system membrane fusion protein
MKPILVACLLFAAVAPLSAIEFGYTEPNRIALATFPETGVIAEITVREGTRVKAGDVLARLNSETLVQDQRIAEEQRRLLQLRYDQIKGLHAVGNVSAEEHERAKSDLEIAVLRVRRIHAQLDDRTLRAPFDGIVTKINREVSESVSAAQTEVMTVVQLDSLRATINLPVRAAADLREGVEVGLVLDDTTRVTGRVQFISPVIDAASRTVRTTFVIPNPDGIHRSGVRCTLESEARIADDQARPAAPEATDLPLPTRRPRPGS